MNASLRLLVCLVSVFVLHPVDAADLSGLNRNMTYREVKTWHEQFLSGQPTPAERLDAMRSIIGTSRIGERGLRNVYGNFEGIHAIDPTIPGVEKTILLQRTSNAAQAKGYRRELLYAINIGNDPRFKLVAMNQLLEQRWGTTDADLLFQHPVSGLYVRVEVKDVSLATQRSNLRKYKAQIDKMAREGRFTGQPQFWINRKDVLPELLKYATDKNVNVLAKVKTGRTPAGGAMVIGTARDRMDQVAIGDARRRLIGGGTQLGFGLVMLLDAAPIALDDFVTLQDPSARSMQAWLRLGEHSAYALAGTGMVLSGSAQLASLSAGRELQSVLFRLGRRGGTAAAAFLLVGEGFAIARYRNGDVTSREFWTSQWVNASALAGSAVGTWVGGSACGVLGGGVGSPICAALGGIAGSLGGQQFGSRTMDIYYDWKFEKLDESFGNSVYTLYGVN